MLVAGAHKLLRHIQNEFDVVSLINNICNPRVMTGLVRAWTLGNHKSEVVAMTTTANKKKVVQDAAEPVIIMFDARLHVALFHSRYHGYAIGAFVDLVEQFFRVCRIRTLSQLIECLCHQFFD